MSRPHVVAPSELSALRDLELATRATVEGLRQGLHRSPFHGYSAEFSQYRHYRPGDDLKYVDWKAFARTDRIYTRQFRETTNLQALFVVDVSRSMDFPQGRTKLALARAIAAILGTLVLDQGDAAGVLAVGDRVSLVPPRSGHHHLRVFLAQVASLQPAGASGVAEGLRRATAVMKRRGLIVVLSDFYEEGRRAGRRPPPGPHGPRRCRRPGAVARGADAWRGGRVGTGGCRDGPHAMVVQPEQRTRRVSRRRAGLAERHRAAGGAGRPRLPAPADRRAARARAAPVPAFAARERGSVSITWLVPAAFGGLALVAVPIAIHLLVRQHSRQVPFPSLRFLEASRLAALKRRSIQDAPLLLCRVLMIAAAVAALAAPVIDTAARRAEHAKRVARAVVIGEGLDRADRSRVKRPAHFAYATFSRARLADGLADAVRWLETQPPASREIVIAATFRRGQLHQSDIDRVPADIGIRLKAQAPRATAPETGVPGDRAARRATRARHAPRAGGRGVDDGG